MLKILRAFASLKLTVVLLALAMVLVFTGTLAQVGQGIWAVVDQYFHCFMAKIDLSIFFPRNTNAPDFFIPFPGGFLIGSLLALNLIAVHLTNFKMQATGMRRMMGVLIFLLGVLVTAGVMLGWGTAPVASTDNAAFWRVFLRLGRGSLAAVVIYLSFILLYRKRAGMVLLHGGILFLLVGETLTALFAVESSMTIAEGETVGFIDRSQRVELSFTDTSHPDYDQVSVIPDNLLKEGQTISIDELPFDIRINSVMPSSTPPTPLQNLSPATTSGYPAYKGNGAQYFITAQRSSGSRSAAAADVELIDRTNGQSIGRYIFSPWFYSNYASRQWDKPEQILVGNKIYEAYLRPQREYLVSEKGNPYSIKLNDFVHEKYEGTQMPKDFSSSIRLINEKDQVDRELRIWMNNPLRYARRTFYQSGYLPNDKGTVLQVVRNDSWMIPYLSCMIVFVGMADQFLRSFGRFRQRGKNIPSIEQEGEDK